jgi:hypothetical protein
MAIEYKKTSVALVDHVAAGDAEALLAWFGTHPKARVNLKACVHVHPAVVQVLLAADAAVSAWPEDEGLKDWLDGPLKAVGQNG